MHTSRYNGSLFHAAANVLELQMGSAMLSLDVLPAAAAKVNNGVSPLGMSQCKAATIMHAAIA